MLIECFHLQNETVNGVKDMSQKIINKLSYKVCRQLPCLSCTQKWLFYCCSCHWGTQSTIQCINKFTSEFLRIGAVNPNTPDSAPVCTMFSEIARYFLHVFPWCQDNNISMIMMTPSSKFCTIFWRCRFKSWLRPCCSYEQICNIICVTW